jgi:DNA-binding MarR family transcriptional regulator
VAKNVGTLAVGTLAGELKQTKPFQSVELEAVLGLLRTSEVVRNFMTDEMGLEGITTAQYNVLRILRGAGAGGLPTLDIRDRLVERNPGVTRMITRLLEKKLVARRRCDEDRRVVYCEITATGLQLLEKYDSRVSTVDQLSMGGLSGSEAKQLIVLLDKVRADLAARGLRAPSTG